MVASAVRTRSLHENSARNMLGSSVNRQGMSLVWQVIFTFSHPISRQLQEKTTVTHCRPVGEERFLHFSDRMDFSWLQWMWFHGHFSTRTDLSSSQAFLLGGFLLKRKSNPFKSGFSFGWISLGCYWQLSLIWFSWVMCWFDIVLCMSWM